MRRATLFAAIAGMALLAIAPLSASITISNVDTAGAQRIADAVLSVPQIADVLPDGSTLVLSLGSATFSGTVTAGAIIMTAVDAVPPNPTLHATLDHDAAMSLLNAYDRVNTAKLILRSGYAGVSGSDSVNAGARLIASGSIDDRLQVEPPAAGDAIRHQDATGTLRPIESAFIVKLGTHDYLVDTLGGVIADLGISSFREPPAGTVVLDPFSGASYGVQPLDEGCVADSQKHLLWGYELTTCEWESLGEEFS